MKTIQLQIDDSNYESFLNIIQNLKDGFIKSFRVESSDSIEYVSSKEQHYYEELLHSMSEEDKKVVDRKTIKL